MAVGDTVSGVFNSLQTLSFQPAAGVEAILTILIAHNTSIYLTDGANFGRISVGATTTLQQITCKIMVTNSIYVISSGASADGSCYSGLQIK